MFRNCALVFRKSAQLSDFFRSRKRVFGLPLQQLQTCPPIPIGMEVTAKRHFSGLESRITGPKQPSCKEYCSPEEEHEQGWPSTFLSVVPYTPNPKLYYNLLSGARTSLSGSWRINFSQRHMYTAKNAALPSSKTSPQARVAHVSRAYTQSAPSPDSSHFVGIPFVSTTAGDK